MRLFLVRIGSKRLYIKLQNLLIVTEAHLKKEIQSINLILSNKEKPVSCIIGGSKVSAKINVISNLTKKLIILLLLVRWQIIS